MDCVAFVLSGSFFAFLYLSVHTAWIDNKKGHNVKLYSALDHFKHNQT